MLVSTWHYTNPRATTVLVSFSGCVGGSGALLLPGQTLVFNDVGGGSMSIWEPWAWNPEEPAARGQQLEASTVQALAGPGDPT